MKLPPDLVLSHEESETLAQLTWAAIEAQEPELRERMIERIKAGGSITDVVTDGTTVQVSFLGAPLLVVALAELSRIASRDAPERPPLD